MPVDLYQLSDKFLHRSSYWIDLTESVIAAAYPEKILVGLTEDQFGTGDTPDAIKFSTRGAAIPATHFFAFTTCSKRAFKAYQNNDRTEFEMVLFKITRAHELVAQFHEWQGDMVYRLAIRWNFKLDRNYLKKLDQGLAEPVKGVEDGVDHKYLRRGCMLSFQNLEILMEHLPALIEASFFEREDSESMVLKFIDFVLARPQVKAFVESKLEEFPKLHYKSKVKILRDLLVQMYDDATQNKEEIPYQMKTYHDYLVSKTNLIFSLLNCHLTE